MTSTLCPCRLRGRASKENGETRTVFLCPPGNKQRCPATSSNRVIAPMVIFQKSQAGRAATTTVTVKPSVQSPSCCLRLRLLRRAGFL